MFIQHLCLPTTYFFHQYSLIVSYCSWAVVTVLLVCLRDYANSWPLSLPGLLELNVSGCPWSSVSALCQAACPCLRLLDLSRVEDMKDSHLRELLAPPTDTRTG